jgi:hypothetical protein
MNADSVQIVGKVEMIYSDLIVDTSVAVSASETNTKASEAQLIDGKSTPDRKWFAFRENTLDGSCHFIPADKSEEIAWWSKQASDSSGVFAVPLVITVSFNPKAVGVVAVYGDVLLNNFPVDFTVKIYAGATLLHTTTVVDNVEVTYLKGIPNQFNATSMVLSITKINKPLVPAKVLEFYRSVKETYDGDRIITMNVLEEIHYDTNGIPLGNISSNELDLVLENFDDKFTPGNTASLVQAYMKRYRLAKPYVGVVNGGSTNWYSLGQFWTVSWVPDAASSTVAITAFDRLELFNNTEFNTSVIYEGYTVTALFTLILTNAGCSNTEYTIDAVFDSIIIPYAWFERGTHREALRQLAEGTSAFVYVDRANHIVVTRADTHTDPVITFDDNVNVIAKSYPTVLSEVTNYVQVEAKIPSLQASAIVYSSEESVVVGAGQSVVITCAFSQVPVKTITSYTLTGKTNTTLTVTNLYCWGAVLTLTNAGATVETITKIELVGTIVVQASGTFVLAKSDASIIDDGRLPVSVSNRFIQSTAQAQALADYLLATYLNSRRTVVLDTTGDTSVLLRDSFSVLDAVTSNIEEYLTTRQDIKYDGGLEIQVVGKFLHIRTNTHKYLSGKTHTELNSYTHQELNGGI